MKTKNNFYQHVVKTIFVFSILFVTSCSSDDDNGPTENISGVLPSTVLTSYSGELGYTSADGSLIVAETSGTATISKSGNTYTITFSNGVPSITGLRFSGSNGNYASTSGDGSAVGISINENKLEIGATINGNNWGFSGTK
ncbi:hypothetical protein [Aquimarina sp. AU58]|uniref:hypothetical protein n=1 Tax=Aquimarina sp. AU58 TaxID=1874112 RepID=UPI000D65D262|nr:hypothetical protein [Aquimarina sp. AU58]